MNFAPLHVRTGYSFLKSGLTIENLFRALKKHGYTKAGICDLKVLYGLPSFEKTAQAYQFDYALGMEAPLCYQNHDLLMCLYAEDEIGYRQLIKLSSYLSHHEKGDLSNFDFSHLLAVLSSNQPFMNENLQSITPQFTSTLHSLSQLFAHFYLGIEIYENSNAAMVQRLRDFAQKYDYEVLAFPLIAYIQKEDAITLAIVEAIAHDEHLDKNVAQEDGIYYLRTLETMSQLYTAQELALSEKVFAYLKVNLSQKRGHLLHYPCENGDSHQALHSAALEGLQNKNLSTLEYLNRLEYELEVIEKMGYCDYFLIVADYVNYAKSHDIPVGPGRGSAASSLVSFALNITTVDPIKYNLLFESFLNPARVSMPDIDIDFGDLKRDLVVDYLHEKYGHERVASIITFQTIGAKQSIRDIGRVYNFSSFDIDMLAKAIPDNSLSLRNAYRRIPAFKKLVDSDKYYLDIIRLASKIEGLPRQAGIHAAGVVLNNEPLEECLPVIIAPNGTYISQYEMNPLAEQGFLKMDILGLRNLSIIENCLKKINSAHGSSLTMDDIPYEDDKQIFALIASTKTMGVFQLESSGIKRAIKELQPTCFEDVVAVLALFRPGPIDNIPIYARRKAGLEEPTYFTPELKDILSSTYGIIVYQEQVLQVVEKIASFTLSEADLFRRAISKKDAQKLIMMKDKFIKGATNNGYSKALANQIYDHIYRFADYGFKRAHSVAYAIISCKMAYLKVHYPAYFYAAILEGSYSANESKFVEYVSEMKSLGLTLHLPSINESTDDFIVKDDGLRFPLSSIKGISGNLVKTIVEERNKAPFISFFDFVIRLYDQRLNSGQLQNLINAGAFDEFHRTRATLLKAVDGAIEYASMVYHDYQPGIINEQIILPPPIMVEVNDDPISKCQNEANVLGVMVTKTPLSFLKDEMEKHHILALATIKKNERGPLTFAGILKSFKMIKTKKGEPMAFLLFFDDDTEQEVVLFPNLYAQNYTKLEKNKIFIITAHFESNQSCIADNLQLWEELKNG